MNRPRYQTTDDVIARAAAGHIPKRAHTRKPLPLVGIGAGLLLIAAWFAATRTTLLFAYGHAGAPISLSQAQGLCDSSLGQFARALSAQGATACSRIDSLSMWLNAAGFVGLLLLLVGGGALLAYQMRRQPVTR